MGIVKRRSAGGVSSGSAGPIAISNINFPGSVNNGGDAGPSASVDLAIGFNHIFRVNESVLITAAGWIEGASFTVDLINDTAAVHGVSWQGFDFLSVLPTEIQPNSRYVFTGKCVLSEDGSQQFYQITLVGVGGAV